jgi:hypothetical protein
MTTTAAKTARITLSIDFTGLGDTGTDSAPFTLNFADDFEHNALEETAEADQGTVEARIIGTDVFVKDSKGAAPDPSFHLPPLTKPWIHLSLPMADQSSPSALSSLLGGSDTDPTGLVKLLTGASSSVTRLGTDLVRGQQSTHYRLSLDAAKIAKLDGEMGDCASDPASEASSPVDVWLDGHGRLTRMKLSQKFQLPSASDFPIPPRSTGMPTDVPTGLPTNVPSGWPTDIPTGLPSAATPDEQPAITTTIEVYDYGTVLNVTPPPADQVQDVTKYVDPSKLNPTPSLCPTR